MPVSCLCWIPKGMAKSHPRKSKYSSESILKMVQEHRSTAFQTCGNTELPESQTQVDADTGLSEYNLQSYDQEDENQIRNIFNNNSYEDDMMDPSIGHSDSESENSSDIVVGPNDNLAVIGITCNDINTLEIYLFNDESQDWYIHHDIPVRSCPLCVEWLDYSWNINEKGCNGNLIAVGTTASFINIWDIDVVNCLQPVATLIDSSNGKDDSPQSGKSSLKGHSNSVLDLSWNRSVRTILASASADHTVILWDVALAKGSDILSHHSDKVQSIQWHPFEAQLLLTGSADKTVKLVDCRVQQSAINWNHSEEIEKVIWNPFCPTMFLIGSCDGSVQAFDVRNRDCMFQIDAHNMAVTDLALSYQTEGLLVTSSVDKTVKVWDVGGKTPKFVGTKNLDIGTIYCSCICPDNASAILFGGQKNSVSLVDLYQELPIFSHFCSKRPSTIILNG